MSDYLKPAGKPNRIVVALGGNALGNTPLEQMEKVDSAAPALLSLSEMGNDIVVTHGNGPQVGMIQKAFAYGSADDKAVPQMDLPECGAMSQGYIGYHLQKGLDNAIHKMNKDWKVVTVVTQVEVDEADPAFKSPTKPIGNFMNEEELKAAKAENPDWSFVEDSGRGYRRVVASPKPKAIVEIDAVRTLVDDDFIVITSGGGGIPVIADASGYRGVASVIDKDLAGELLAEEVDAEMLILLTAVDFVSINFGKPNEEQLKDLTVDEAEKYADLGEFGKGSMEPKVRAAIKFAKSKSGRVALIGSLDKAAQIVKGESGTKIHA